MRFRWWWLCRRVPVQRAASVHLKSEVPLDTLMYNLCWSTHRNVISHLKSLLFLMTLDSALRTCSIWGGLIFEAGKYVILFFSIYVDWSMCGGKSFFVFRWVVKACRENPPLLSGQLCQWQSCDPPATAAAESLMACWERTAQQTALGKDSAPAFMESLKCVFNLI